VANLPRARRAALNTGLPLQIMMHMFVEC